MPKRQSVKRHDTTEVQGEDSYAILSSVKVKEIKAIRLKSEADPEFDAFQSGLDILADHILGWNWVDDAGDPLPSPKGNPEVLDELCQEEATYLVSLLMGDEESKN